jgi:plasmid stabilization system protein ParE
MTYTVTWTVSARNELVDLWLQATDRAAVTQAANYVDSVLRTSPLDIGEPSDQGRRTLYEPPLVVLYSVSQADCLVTVRAVWNL